MRERIVMSTDTLVAPEVAAMGTAESTVAATAGELAVLRERAARAQAAAENAQNALAEATREMVRADADRPVEKPRGFWGRTWWNIKRFFRWAGEKVRNGWERAKRWFTQAKDAVVRAMKSLKEMTLEMARAVRTGAQRTWAWLKDAAVGTWKWLAPFRGWFTTPIRWAFGTTAGLGAMLILGGKILFPLAIIWTVGLLVTGKLQFDKDHKKQITSKETSNTVTEDGTLITNELTTSVDQDGNVSTSEVTEVTPDAAEPGLPVVTTEAEITQTAPERPTVTYQKVSQSVDSAPPAIQEQIKVEDKPSEDGVPESLLQGSDILILSDSDLDQDQYLVMSERIDQLKKQHAAAKSKNQKSEIHGRVFLATHRMAGSKVPKSDLKQMHKAEQIQVLNKEKADATFNWSAVQRGIDKEDTYVVDLLGNAHVLAEKIREKQAGA